MQSPSVNGKSLAVLIPAFNEEATVASVVRVALAARLGEVLVVSDGSSDATAERARQAGARVLALGENVGKGGAVHAGVQVLTSDLVLLLDADLTGLKPEHLHALAAPVLEGEADTTIGIFADGRTRTDLAHKITPYLSGQRVIERALLGRVPDLEHCKYAIELAVTHQIELEELRVAYVPFGGVAQVMKEEKHGFVAGLGQRVRMFWQILRYASRAKSSTRL